MQQRKVLVADDDEDMLKLVAARLRANGYQVLAASDGAEALKRATEELPDLIVLDLMMPKMDGFDVLSVLKRQPATRWIPVILLTGKTETSTILKSQELQADDYLTKPVDTKQLLALIERYTT